jgi:hypothetical protein
MLAEMTGESPAPGSERGFTDMQSSALFAHRLDDYVHVRVPFIGVKGKRVPMPRAKYILCKMAYGGSGGQ